MCEKISVFFYHAWLILCIFCPLQASANAVHIEKSETPNIQISQTQIRIVSLSPHLTELTYLLGQGKHLVAVSDFSDFPEQASLLPRVASYQGANIPAILRLQPTHVLVWQEGNKQRDIQKLVESNIAVYQSSIIDVDSLLSEITAIANFLNVPQQSEVLLNHITKQLKTLKNSYQYSNKRTFYYLNETPLMALGNDKWLNSLLSLCGLNNVFFDSVAPYPQVSIAQVLRSQPEVLIAASTKNKRILQSRWGTHIALLDAKLIVGNPDKLHRFTPRAISEIQHICEQVYRDDSASPTVQ